MYEVSALYESSFKYKVKSGDYEVKIDFPRAGAIQNGTTPIDLFLGSLGSCLCVYLERYLVGAKVTFESFTVNVKSDISKEAPHYLRSIEVYIDIKGASLDERRKKAILEFIKNCPVHNTLINIPEVNIKL